MNSRRLHFLAGSALQYCGRIRLMAKLAAGDDPCLDFPSRTLRDIAGEAAKLENDLERLRAELATAVKSANSVNPGQMMIGATAIWLLGQSRHG